MTTPTKALTPEDLDRVAEIIQVRWEGRRPKNDPVNGVCLLEAVAEVTTGAAENWTSDDVLALGAEVFTPIILRRHPRRVRKVHGAREVPWMFNDSPWTTRRAVLRVVREAREALQG